MTVGRSALRLFLSPPKMRILLVLVFAYGYLALSASTEEDTWLETHSESTAAQVHTPCLPISHDTNLLPRPFAWTAPRSSPPSRAQVFAHFVSSHPALCANGLPLYNPQCILL